MRETKMKSDAMGGRDEKGMAGQGDDWCDGDIVITARDRWDELSQIALRPGRLPLTLNSIESRNRQLNHTTSKSHPFWVTMWRITTTKDNSKRISSFVPFCWENVLSECKLRRAT
jgi:hypothetical protein